MLTLPAAGATAAVVYGFTRLFGHGAVGPIAVTIVLAIGCFFLWRANKAADRSSPTRSSPPTPSSKPPVHA